MEDAHVHEHDDTQAFFGVFDGHGGEEVAIYVGEHVLPAFKEQRAFLEGDYGKALIDTYKMLDQRLRGP